MPNAFSTTLLALDSLQNMHEGKHYCISLSKHTQKPHNRPLKYKLSLICTPVIEDALLARQAAASIGFHEVLSQWKRVVSYKHWGEDEA